MDKHTRAPHPGELPLLWVVLFVLTMAIIACVYLAVRAYFNGYLVAASCIGFLAAVEVGIGAALATHIDQLEAADAQRGADRP